MQPFDISYIYSEQWIRVTLARIWGAVLIKSVFLIFFILATQSNLLAQKELKETNMSMLLSSPAFGQGAMIPDRYSCDGEDYSPPLVIEGVPDEAKSLALICDDPDAPMGSWVHWVVYNLPVSTESLEENIDPSKTELESGALQGSNSWGRIGWGGPCPPSGTHRYFFRLYALDCVLELGPGATKAKVLKFAEEHLLEQCELMGPLRQTLINFSRFSASNLPRRYSSMDISSLSLYPR